MLEVLTITILKAMASTCVKLYVSSLLGGGAIAYDKADLGYKVPRWYMNYGRSLVLFHSFGTSVEGDEFESLEAAKEKAIAQMVKHIRLSNRKLVAERVGHDKDSVKQKRFVDLFIRGPGLDEFVRVHAGVSKREFVKVPNPEPDMRAFVRLSLHSKVYLEYQNKAVKTLKKRLMRQKVEDILAEMDSEKKGAEGGLKGMGATLNRTDLGMDATPSSADDAFEELQKETAK